MFKEPTHTGKKTVAEVKSMAPRQEVRLIEVYVCKVKAGTNMVEMRGEVVETQICYVQDATGWIKVHLWEGQIGMLVSGHAYRMSNMATREFGSLYLTATSSTEIHEVEVTSGLRSLQNVEVEEEVIKTLIGKIIRAEIVVSRRCTKCRAYQRDFNSAKAFHRCERCGFLQKMDTYMRSASGRVAFVESLDEMDLAVSNSVIQNYLQHEGLLQLLVEGQNVEEHLLCGETWKLQIESDVVVAIEKVEDDGRGTGAQMDRSTDEEVAGAVSAIETDV
nr:uncharacterized protein LOC129451220 [Misgurnus anguillicaudatus]XP_055070262.1 uncharacterized protein LOC129451220 [Misgurnus anguillicaudatus]